ncbi:hypothetical protein GALMADRAFT_247359 [Galerina marginata CBS 339.88]|uniref:G-protein coupled receptors family 1 profile domain-containing protein n=1 Tax=Galerina marginata (strain CBS 339.88) TaxID=685588 RepID=A0A067TAX0_GALM3|nr:hypothetical protein GALMADRAFT_247359 [Galerina marginata CBS 339.88]
MDSLNPGHGTPRGPVFSTKRLADPLSTSTENFRVVVAFDSISIVAIIFLPIIILTAAFSSRIVRVSTWFMVVGSMLMISVANVLLLGHQTGPLPPRALCLIQAMLMYGYPNLASFAGVSFMIQVYLSIRLALRTGSKLSKASERWLCIIPCLMFLATLVEVLVIGLLNSKKIKRDPSGAYCDFITPVPYLKVSLILFAVLVMFVLQALIILKIRRGSRSLGAFHPAEHVSIDAVVRVCVFNFASVLVIVVSFIQSFPHRIPMLDFLSILSKALVPFCAVVVFGTQRDLLHVWMFWRRPPLTSHDPL